MSFKHGVRIEFDNQLKLRLGGFPKMPTKLKQEIPLSQTLKKNCRSLRHKKLKEILVLYNV